MGFVSLLISFLKMPLHVRDFFLKHKMLTDIGAAAIIFLIVGGISKTITGLVASIFAGLLIGIGIEVADMAAKDDEVKAKLEDVKINMIHVAKERVRKAVLNIPVLK